MSAAAAPPVLRMAGISKSFGATAALDGVGFELARGEVHALIGENGAGKSTMMKVLSGALAPDAGRMEIDGRPYAPAGPGDGLRCGVSMIYQELNLAPHLTVEENIMLGREVHRAGWLDRAAMRRKVREALELVRHPEISPDVPVGRLSVGARQLVEIARALLNRSRILVMDEPTSSLTQEDSQRLFEIIRGLKGQDVGVIYISHFLEEVQRVADSYTVLRDGRSVGSGPMAGTALEDIIQLMVGRKFSQLFPRVEHAVGGPVLSVERLKGPRMAAPVTLALAKGEILGVAGLVGSGRTEMLRALFGLDEVEGGTVV
ncbi:MAG TPA: sugar ABC transporter ATP-binding protein, partial [Acidobacteriota bacterium]|nr:sugar ABC transporter ATP-binding protein [Acidobacteriota bacterium]